MSKWIYCVHFAKTWEFDFCQAGKSVAFVERFIVVPDPGPEKKNARNWKWELSEFSNLMSLHYLSTEEERKRTRTRTSRSYTKRRWRACCIPKFLPSLPIAQVEKPLVLPLRDTGRRRFFRNRTYRTKDSLYVRLTDGRTKTVMRHRKLRIVWLFRDHNLVSCRPDLRERTHTFLVKVAQPCPAGSFP